MIKYETGDLETAKKYWEQSIKIDNKQTEPQLALAVAIYTQGDKTKGLELAKTALKIDKRFGKIEYLKEQIWQDKLIRDTKILLNEPTIKAFLNQKT